MRFLGLLTLGAAVTFMTAPIGVALSQPERASTTMYNGTGDAIGTVAFTQVGSWVHVDVDVSGLTPGFHGFHVHVTGSCDAATDFNSAGGHLAVSSSHPAGGTHVEHAGDMTNLFVGTDGVGSMSVWSDRFAIGDLLAEGGRAVIIHGDPDNFVNIPARYGVTPDEATLNTGDAGPRMACGVLHAG